MKYLLSTHLFMIYCLYQSVAIKVKSKNGTHFVINKNTKSSNEKYKNHNMDGWTPIRPTLDYLKLRQRKNCVSIGFYNADCQSTEQLTEKSKTPTLYESIVESFRRDYRSPYGNYVAELVPKLPNHYINPIPRFPPSQRRQFRRFSTKLNIELPRFMEEHRTNRFTSRSFQESASKYSKRHRYPMFEPIPGQILYPPTVPQFKSNPFNEISKLQSRYDNDITHSRTKTNIKTIQSTMFPFFEHEAVTKKSSTLNKQYVRNSSQFDTTSPVLSMVIQPTTIKISSTKSSITPTKKTSTIGPPIQYVYSVAVNETNKNNILNDFEKELPRKVVLESPPKKYSGDHQVTRDGNNMISTKLSNRFLEYTTSGYSVYVTIKPSLDRPETATTESLDEEINNIPKINKNPIKVIPLLHSGEENSDFSDDVSSIDNAILKSSFQNGNDNKTYNAKKAGFKTIIQKRSKKTTLKPLIYTLSSLLLDTDQGTSHQLSKPGQYYVDHLSSTIINDYDGKIQPTKEPAEAVRSSITIKHQPPLPNKSNNQNTTNSRWTQPYELYAINNNNGINDRDQIKDINLDIVITTDGPTTNRNQIYENKNDLGINDSDEWNDGNVDSNSRALSGYGRVNVEPNIEWIMVAKSSKLNKRNQKSRSVRLTSSSYKDYIIPMSKKEMPKVNNSSIVLGTTFLVQ